MNTKQMKKTLTQFDIRTGWHQYEEGQVWEEGDGPSFLGCYTLIDGVKYEIPRKFKRLSIECYYGRMDRRRLQQEIVEWLKQNNQI